MIPILYDSNELSFTSNGLGRLRDCISCMVTEERNGVYECDFSYPVDGANFDLIIPGRIIGVRHDDTEDIQPFDIVSYSKPIDGIVEFHSVHISYRLREMPKTSRFIDPITNLKDALEYLGGPIEAGLGTTVPWDAYHQFHFSSDFDMDARFAAPSRVPTPIRSMMGGMEGSIIDSYGGEWEFDKFNVILHRNRGQDRDFTIRYGVNLTDYKEETDFTDTYNAAWPYWSGSDGVGDSIEATILPVTLEPSTYAERQIIAPLDLSSKYQNKPTAGQLQEAARTYMQRNQTTIPKRSIDVSFIRLQDLGEYEMLETLLQCNLCDTINVVFPAYDMQGRYKIVKTVYDVLRGGYDSMELGTLQTTLAEALGISSESPTNSGADVIYYEDDTVKVNAPIEVNGSVTSNGNKLVSASADGGSGTVENVASGATPRKNLATVSLPDEGVYMLVGLARFQTNANGRRGLCWGSTATGYYDHTFVVVPPVNGDITRIQSVGIVTVTSAPFNVYLNCYHTAGTQLDVDYYWRYIKLA